VRVQGSGFRVKGSVKTNHPLPCPLPEYRERGKEEQRERGKEEHRGEGGKRFLICRRSSVR